MVLNNVVLVYKKSIYQIYFEEEHYQLSKENRFSKEAVDRLLTSHVAHQNTLKTVRRVLNSKGLGFREIYRARNVHYSDDDFIISVGGDGTFLEAARRITTQAILGVNSDPERSVGNFCAVDEAGFEPTIERILNGKKLKTHKLNRMKMKLNGQYTNILVANDILISHQYPGAMSRYNIGIGDIKEEHKGSGIWISTAAGSSGAIAAAKGKKMPLGSHRLQYLPRELFPGKNGPYKLTGGFVNVKDSINLISGMREGIVYVDGAHLRIPFRYGSTLTMTSSEYPLNVIHL